jgi:hypothetical protein
MTMAISPKANNTVTLSQSANASIQTSNHLSAIYGPHIAKTVTLNVEAQVSWVRCLPAHHQHLSFG